MSVLLSLTWRSLLNRWTTVALTVFSIAISVALLLGVEKVRTEARAGFANTIAGTDLVVGARSGSIQLLLYSVFRIGNATNNISWESYRELSAHPAVAWTIPLSLGDSHKGFRVLGTNADYFRHYRYGHQRLLAFSSGGPFVDLFDAVIGADVAEALGYRVGTPIVVAHGLGKVGFTKHENSPFKVVGVLAKTGTPVDRTVHVGLEAIEAIHVGWQGGRMPKSGPAPEALRTMALTPKTVTAFLVGLKSKMAVFTVQRRINEFKTEPLLAILPGVALQELWGLIGSAETALTAISAFVVASGLLGMLTMILASQGERRREMAILRAVGARPGHIFTLFLAEAVIVAGGGAVIGLALYYVLLAVGQPLIDARFGLFLEIGWPSARDLIVLALVVGGGALAGIIPAYRAYRRSLADGMMVRI